MTSLLRSFRRLFPTGENYVTEAGLNHLRNYKYRSVDKSFLTKYVLRHYWNWAVTLFPTWIAPNLITLIGLSFEIFDVLLVLLFVPDLFGPGPAWMYYCFGAGIWLYSTFDNVDGKQARRTNTSSPLGELFDHGCDALNCSIAGVVEAASFAMGDTWTTLGLFLCITWTFYISTWEEYHTGVLYLGYVNGPTEFIVFACIACILSGYYGPQIWHVNAQEYIPVIGHWFPESWELISAMVLIVIILTFTVQFGTSLANVYSACKEKNKSFLATLPHLVPYFALIWASYIWADNSYWVIGNTHMILYIFVVGFAFGRMVSKMILAHLMGMAFPAYTVQMLPVFLGAFFSKFGMFSPTTELVFMWCSLVFVVVAYFQWAIIVIDRFCEHLNIKCLTIPDIRKANPKEKGAKDS
ncbi:hypothetical protein H4219_002290 [Mycoemilia scoparia]|uniref:Uncharacterized protein n=1 Tax=Mycoemilia scoparia TaxID=417184 RepID=A0A9W8DU90_9FUNG|nr:hypothetical protein H4219_002290 [Mycoemilia scoparia]